MHDRPSRRTILRSAWKGALVQVGLPLLDVALDGNGQALASGAPLPRRYGTWFWGNGNLPERWVPAEEGTAYEMTEQLAPLAPMRAHLTVLSGYENRTRGNVHGAGAVGVLTGAGCRGPSEPDMAPVLPSIDQLIARHVGDQTRFRSLEVACTAVADRASVGGAMYNISYAGPGAYNRPDLDCHSVYQRLFGQIPIAELRAQRSVLDVVREDLASLAPSVGRADRARLEQHLDGVRLIERRLSMMSAPSTCRGPDAPPATHRALRDRIHAPVVETMADLVVHALVCDLTRVFSYALCMPGHHCDFDEPPHRGFHSQCHEEPAPQPTVNLFVVRTMTFLARFLDRMASLREGAGTLLDASAILATSDVSTGKTHATKEYPMIVAGRAGGALRTGFHHRSTTQEPTSKVPLTLARCLGVPLASFGRDHGLVRDSIRALEA
jgi:hypothetical protein